MAILRNVPSSSMICSRSWHPAPMPVAGWSSCRERETDRTVANSDTASSSELLLARARPGAKATAAIAGRAASDRAAKHAHAGGARQCRAGQSWARQRPLTNGGGRPCYRCRQPERTGWPETKKLVPSMENLVGKRETKVKRSNETKVKRSNAMD